jgi:hypothetical protein
VAELILVRSIMTHSEIRVQNSIGFPLQVLSAALLLFGWWGADRITPPHSVGPPHRGDLILLSIWLIGAVAAGTAWTICRQRRFLSAVEFALNVGGVVMAGIVIWGSSVPFH